MKKLILLLWIPLLFSCEDEAFPTKNPRVDVFVAALIEGKYEQDFMAPLPDFSAQDIPALLHYANDFREIAYFPVNPISSFAPPAFRLGECLLWVIEAIRTSTGIDANQLRYPSLVPVLVKENDPNEGREVLNEELQEAYTLYKNWWEDNRSSDFNTFSSINPLAESGYQWR